MPAARVEHLGARGADPAKLPSLFAGMMAVASMSMTPGLRPLSSTARCARPNARMPHISLRRLTDALARRARLSELIIHHVQGPGGAALMTEQVHMVRRHSTSTRCCCVGAEESRGAAPTRSTAAAAAALLGARPQGPHGPAPPLTQLVEHVVCLCVVHVGSVCSPPCRAREAMFVKLSVTCSVDLCRY